MLSAPSVLFPAVRGEIQPFDGQPSLDSDPEESPYLHLEALGYPRSIGVVGAAAARTRPGRMPVPAGISAPIIVACFMPMSESVLPLTAASVSTRRVYWNEAALSQESVCSDA